MNDNQRLFGMISISKKAGALVTGESRTEEAVRNDKAYLILLTEDASDNTKKKFSDMSSYRNVPLVYLSDRITFGRIIGKKFAVSGAVLDKGLAESILKLY